MRKILAAAAGLILALGVVGCDKDGSSGKSEAAFVAVPADPPARTVVPSRPKDQAQSKALAEVEQLKDSVADRPQTPATSKAALDRFFDNNHASGDAVSAAGAVRAPSEAAMRRKAERVNAQLASYKSDEKGKSGDGDQPKAKTLPTVPLPDAAVAADDANVRGGGATLVAFDAFMRAAGLPDKVFSRAFWGASASTAREGHQSPTRVTIHHTDSARQTLTVEDSRKVVKGIQDFHQGPQKFVEKNGKQVNVGGRDWGDIGYHFVVDGGGNVFEGRHADVMGAHVWKHNENNLGIANIGDYNRDQLTDAQKDTLKRLISFLALKYNTDPTQEGFIQGHGHFADNNTDCPGNNIKAFLPELRKLVGDETASLVARGGAGGFVPLVITNPNAS